MKKVFGSFIFQLSSLFRNLCETEINWKIAKIDQEDSCLFSYNHHSLTLKIVSMAKQNL